MMRIATAVLAVATGWACKTTTSQAESAQPARAADPGTGGGGAAPADERAPAPSLAAPPVEPGPSRCDARGRLHFDFDSHYIKPEAREALAGVADCLRRREGPASVTVAGHCDERGSEEYNLALGQRRADAVRKYLADMGVPAALIRTISFGEERPVVQTHDESAWAQNRRAEIE